MMDFNDLTVLISLITVEHWDGDWNEESNDIERLSISSLDELFEICQNYNLKNMNENQDLLSPQKKSLYSKTFSQYILEFSRVLTQAEADLIKSECL